MKLVRAILACALLGVGAAGACGGGSNAFDPPSFGVDGGLDTTDAPPLLGDGARTRPGPCVKLQCQQVDCPNGGTTTVSGTVFAPSMASPDPLYNAIVYVPNADLAPFPKGVSCDQCGALASGSPIVTALSGADGKFTLKDVPVGDAIPFVVQLGRWRRKVVIPHVEACTDNAIDASMTHLPRNQSEGDIPQMAIATGKVDPLECVLRKIGIDDSEFTTASGNGRVHFFVENGMNTNPPSPAASTLWSSLGTLQGYDVVMLPCEGQANLKPPAATQNLIDYASLGGRVFASHYSYVWVYDAQAPFPATAQWTPNQVPFPSDPLAGTIDTSFAKGKAMADWLMNVGASPSYGQIAIHAPRHDADTVNSPPSQGWISSVSPVTAQHFTFNTPIGADAGAQCGKVVFSDFHVAIDEATAGFFPNACVPGTLTAQEKVIEFMLFDLSSCIQDDGQIPKPPPPVK